MVLSLLSLAGIAVLFFLHFSSKNQSGTETVAKTVAFSGDGIKVAFINSDTLRKHYELVKELSTELENNYRIKETEIAARQRTYEKDAAYFQKQVAEKTISEASAQMIYEELMKSQQDILDLRDRFTEELTAKEYQMNLEFIDSVDHFLERYNKTIGYDYILGFSKGSGILHANDTFDITMDVLEKMNAEYIKNNLE